MPLYASHSNIISKSNKQLSFQHLCRELQSLITLVQVLMKGRNSEIQLESFLLTVSADWFAGLHHKVRQHFYQFSELTTFSEG